MSRTTEIREQEEKLWKRISENNKLLNSCEQHLFSIDVTPEKTIAKRWKCERCGGVVENINKYWYEQGLKHK